MSKTIIMVLVAAVLVAAGFAGGYVVANKAADASSATANATGRQGPGGAFMQLTEEERQQLQNMTADERQQFFKDKGIDVPEGFDASRVPSGTADGAPGGAGGMRFRGSSGVEGSVVSVTEDRITVKLNDGGSATLYVDGNTIVAAVSGATPKLVQGASVYAVVEQEAEGVTAAKAVIVK